MIRKGVKSIQLTEHEISHLLNILDTYGDIMKQYQRWDEWEKSIVNRISDALS